MHVKCKHKLASRINEVRQEQTEKRNICGGCPFISLNNSAELFCYLYQGSPCLPCDYFAYDPVIDDD